jgi:enamine deaminase RidA (YjgF/YER057c/UK114 family)
MEERKIITPPHLADLAKAWHFSPGLLIGDTLYIAGTIGVKEDGSFPSSPHDQYIRCFENMKAVLEAADMSFKNVVDLVSYHTDLQHSLADFTEVRNEYIPDPPFPVYAAFGVDELASRELYTEIKATARR